MYRNNGYIMDIEIYNNWINQLPALTVVQLNDVSTRIKLLDKIITKEHVGKQDVGVRVLQAICDTLKKHKVETPSVTSLRKSNAYVGSKDKVDDLAIFLESISKSKLMQDQILRIGIELLYNDLLTWNLPISSHILLRQIHRIPATLNRNFPGYAASGLLVKIVKVA